VNGSGGLPNTPYFTSSIISADLLDQLGDYYCTISEGVGAMPAYGETLTDDEHRMLITFLSTLGPYQHLNRRYPVDACPN
jgi:mono/diheme cytochrome c family protein